MAKKLYSFRFNEEFINIVDRTAKTQIKDRTQFIEEAIREKLCSLNIVVVKAEREKTVYYENIEDIPFEQK